MKRYKDLWKKIICRCRLNVERYTLKTKSIVARSEFASLIHKP